jgi:hypothetical protein
VPQSADFAGVWDPNGRDAFKGLGLSHPEVADHAVGVKPDGLIDLTGEDHGGEGAVRLAG